MPLRILLQNVTVSSGQLFSAPAKAEGRYDIRRGAEGHAPIIGAFGVLAVPAIVVLFTVPRPTDLRR